MAAKENDQFLPTYYDQKEKKKEKGGPCCGCSCCKCVCITVVVVVIVLGAVLLGGYLYMKSKGGNMSSEGSAEWEAKLSAEAEGGPVTREMIAGSYELVSYSEDYRDYIEAFGVPSFLVSLALSMEETIVITVPEEEDGEWTLERKRDISPIKFSFSMGVEFTTPSRFGPMHQTCSQPSPDRLLFDVEQRDKGWRFTSTMTFSRSGMVDERFFKNDQKAAKLFYQKLGVEGVERKEPEFFADEGESPFSDDDGSDPWADEEGSEDDFFGDDDW